MPDPDLEEGLQDRPVLVIGAAGLDMISLLNDEPVEGASNAASIRVSFGGVARNVAENLARLGQPVQLITTVGQDIPGNHLLSWTAEHGVDVRACVTCSTGTTASYLAIFHQDGRRHLVLEDMSVLGSLTAEKIVEQKELFARAAMVFVDANLTEPALQAVFDLAGEARVPVCADATSTRLARKLDPYLERIYMITGNAAEVVALCQADFQISDDVTGLRAARLLVDRGVELAIVTLGEFGVVYATSETSGHVPAIRTPVVDPTGAGDALTATMIFGLLNEIPTDESVRLGVVAASLILRYRGTVLPGLTLEKLYDELVG